MEPKPVLGTKGILPHMYIIFQAIVRACEADVATLKVTVEGEVA